VYSEPLTVVRRRRSRRSAKRAAIPPVPWALLLPIGSISDSAVNYPSGFTASGLSFNGGARVRAGRLVVTMEGAFEGRSACTRRVKCRSSRRLHIPCDRAERVDCGWVHVCHPERGSDGWRRGGALGTAGSAPVRE